MHGDYNDCIRTVEYFKMQDMVLTFVPNQTNVYLFNYLLLNLFTHEKFNH